MELMQNWEVKLQTPLIDELKEDPETGISRSVYHHTQYKFTLAEALEYISNDKHYHAFDEMMLHNVVLRDAIRSFGVKKVIDQIKEFAPASEKLEKLFENFQNKYSDDYIGNLDIQVYSVIEDFQVFGETLHGSHDLLAYREISMEASQTSAKFQIPEKRGKLHVGELWERYPCFDSWDYATESRFYRTCIIRKEPIKETEMLRLKKCGIGERTPLDMLPMVYYGGDGGFMLVATCREEENVY